LRHFEYTAIFIPKTAASLDPISFNALAWTGDNPIEFLDNFFLTKN